MKKLLALLLTILFTVPTFGGAMGNPSNPTPPNQQPGAIEEPEESEDDLEEFLTDLLVELLIP